MPAKATVTFACDCADSHIDALIERASDGGEAARILFERTGKQSVALAAGAYDVAYRAQGIPRTPFSLKVSEGGSMQSVERVMPPEGHAAGVRRLIVAVHSVLAFVVLFLTPTGADAQPLSEMRQRTERALATIPNVSDVLEPGYYLSVESGADSATGTGAVALENGPGSFSAALSLSGPLDRASATKLPRKLDGLPNSGTIKLSLHWFHWPNRPDAAAMRELCEAVLHHADCDDEDFPNGADRNRFLRLAHSSDSPVIASLDGAFGRKAFSYADPSTLETTVEAHANWAVGAAIGRFTPHIGYVALEYEHQRRFRAGATSNICETVSPVATECRSTAVGSPTARRLEIGGVEWRFFFPGGRLAVNPSLSRDLHGRVWAADVPIYFLSLSSAGLAGGARVSWRSDTEDMAIALFVGTALKTTP